MCSMAVRPIRILRRCPAIDGLHAGLRSLSVIPIRVVDLVHRGRCRARGKLKKRHLPCVSRVAAVRNARYFWSTTTNVVPWFGATRTSTSLELPRKTRPKVWLQQDVRKKQTTAKHFTRTALTRPKSIRDDFKCRSCFRFRGLSACLAVPTVERTSEWRVHPAHPVFGPLRLMRLRPPRFATLGHRSDFNDVLASCFMADYRSEVRHTYRF